MKVYVIQIWTLNFHRVVYELNFRKLELSNHLLSFRIFKEKGKFWPYEQLTNKKIQYGQEIHLLYEDLQKAYVWKKLTSIV